MLSGADAAGIALSLSVVALPFEGAMLVTALRLVGDSRRAAAVELLNVAPYIDAVLEVLG